jgi:VCBS repeat-containing protein
VDSATLTYSATLAGGGALPGWLSFNPGTRTFSGTPAAGNVGTLNLSVTASDGSLSVSSGFALVVNAAPNVAPIASNASANATEDTVLTGNLPAASDADGDLITYVPGTAAAHGTVVVNANGFYRYTPNANFNGNDSFGFIVSDNRGGSNSYSVSVTVAAVNDAPVVAVPLANQSATANTAFGFTVPAGTFTDVDSATLTYSATLAGGGALPGWLSFNPGTRAFSGTPAAGNVGTLNLSVTASDGSLSASNGFALVVNAAANRAPTAADLAATTNRDTLLNGTLPAATDADGDAITYALGTAAANGTAVVNANGSYRYTPSAGFSGRDQFGFIVSDGRGGSTTYQVQVTVVATPQVFTGSAGPDSMPGQAGADIYNALGGNDTVTAGRATTG